MSAWMKARASSLVSGLIPVIRGHWPPAGSLISGEKKLEKQAAEMCQSQHRQDPEEAPGRLRANLIVSMNPSTLLAPGVIMILKESSCGLWKRVSMKSSRPEIEQGHSGNQNYQTCPKML